METNLVEVVPIPQGEVGLHTVRVRGVEGEAAEVDQGGGDQLQPVHHHY